MNSMQDNTRRSRRRLLAFVPALLLLAAAPLFAQKPSTPRAASKPAASAATTESCVNCHTSLDDGPKGPVALESKSVHKHAGFSCSGCHGGDPAADDADVAMSPSHGFVGAPSAQAVAGFCGRCHSDASLMKRYNPTTRIDQQAEYASSGHGKTLAKGDTKVATCISCHGSHGILAVADANSPVYPSNVASTCGRCHGDKDLMSSYGVFDDQVVRYASSVHGRALMKKGDLSAPTCNDCHGNHGAAPPGVSNVAHVCGTCHVRQADLYASSKHAGPFAEGSIAGCVACHGDHNIAKPSDDFLGTGKQSMCTGCHTEGDAGYRVADRLRSSRATMELSIASADRMLARASEAGMEVSKPEYELRDARDKLINARVLVHGLAVEPIDSLVKSGGATSRKAEEAGVAALKELDFRRNGLSISLVVILIAAIAVYVKVRQIDRAKKVADAQNAVATNGTGHAPAPARPTS
jgi:predicted CXXCH cytochrome family protein